MINELPNPQKARIYSNSRISSDKGYLYTLNDSSIVISSSFQLSNKSNPLKEIPYQNIRQLSLQRNDKAGNGMFIGMAIGALGGFVTGAIIDKGIENVLKSHSNRSSTKVNNGQVKLIFGIGGAIVGTTIGGIIGSIKIQIPIDGKLDDYQKGKTQTKVDEMNCVINSGMPGDKIL